MKDQIIKGTGDSRFMRSSIPTDATLADIIAMLRAGEFPFDFAGYNAEGIDTFGTELNKENLLQDSTANLLDLTSEATINDFLAVVANLLNSIQQNIQTNYVPVTRTVNGKNLQTNISLDKSDVNLGKVLNQTISFSLDSSTSTLDITVS